MPAFTIAAEYRLQTDRRADRQTSSDSIICEFVFFIYFAAW